MIDNDSSETAFPQPIGQTVESMQGMSLLDWFAGQALAGLMAIGVFVEVESEETLARMAYDQSEAMIIERKKRRYDSRTTETPR